MILATFFISNKSVSICLQKLNKIRLTRTLLLPFKLLPLRKDTHEFQKEINETIKIVYRNH